MPGKVLAAAGSPKPVPDAAVDYSQQMSRRLLTALCMFLAAPVMLVASAFPAWAAQAITLTWVRHAQSTANAAGIIDTTVPGPGLSALGETQAQAIADTLKNGGYDGIYVSDMVRTQLTAAPLAADLGITPVVLPGIQEINAGIFEGGSGPIAGIGYALPPAAWVLGARFVPVLGGYNGNRFEANVNGAVQTVYDTGQTNPVLFSHGATIMAWTMMNVSNPDLVLAVTHPLGNTAVVVMTGSPQDGWTLQSWDGVAVDPNPSLLTSLFVALRSLVVAPQTASYDLHESLRNGGRDAAPVATVAPAVSASAVSVAPVASRQAGRTAAPGRSTAVTPAAAAVGTNRHGAQRPPAVASRSVARERAAA